MASTSENDNQLNLSVEQVDEMLGKITQASAPDIYNIVYDIIKSKNKNYFTRLMEAEIKVADLEEIMLIFAVELGCTEYVRILLDKGADPNYLADGDDKALIRSAAEEGHLEIVKLLLAAGADVNKAPEEHGGFTALHGAAAEGHLEILKVLLEAGAQLDSVTWFNSTALADACYMGQEKCAEMLIKAGANVNMPIGECGTSTTLIAAAMGGNEKCVELIIKTGVDVNAPGRDGDSALHEAAKNADCKSLDVLLQAKADVNEINEEGYTALMFAVYFLLSEEKQILRENLGEEAAFDRCYNATKLLLKAGADVHGEAMGNTVWNAVKRKNLKCVELLYQAGASIEGSISDDIPRKESSLKHLCREKIRNILMDLHPHSNLVISVPRLNLPSSIASYLLCGLSLDEDK